MNQGANRWDQQTSNQLCQCLLKAGMLSDCLYRLWDLLLFGGCTKDVPTAQLPTPIPSYPAPENVPRPLEDSLGIYDSIQRSLLATWAEKLPSLALLHHRESNRKTGDTSSTNSATSASGEKQAELARLAHRHVVNRKQLQILLLVPLFLEPIYSKHSSPESKTISLMIARWRLAALRFMWLWQSNLDPVVSQEDQNASNIDHPSSQGAPVFIPKSAKDGQKSEWDYESDQEAICPLYLPTDKILQSSTVRFGKVEDQSLARRQFRSSVVDEYLYVLRNYKNLENDEVLYMWTLYDYCILQWRYLGDTTTTTLEMKHLSDLVNRKCEKEIADSSSSLASNSNIQRRKDFMPTGDIFSLKKSIKTCLREWNVSSADLQIDLSLILSVR